MFSTMSGEHAHRKHAGTEWMDCTLCRSRQQSVIVLKKAKERRVEWPKSREDCTGVQDPLVFTSIDDAFANILQALGTSSKHCKRYYKSCEAASCNKADQLHCDRFHTPHYTKVVHRNPLQSSEAVHVVVEPGSYAITAGEKDSQQTHLVHMHAGHSVNLNFVI